jgi:hypothetical protein
MNDVENDYENPLSNASEAASTVGRKEAVNAIFERGMALRDAANSGQGTEAARKAQGALQIWRAAYAAAYREMLAIEDQLEAYARGAGQMDEIPEHPDELERHFESYTYMKAVCAKVAEARQAAKAAGDEGRPFLDPITACGLLEKLLGDAGVGG